MIMTFNIEYFVGFLFLSQNNKNKNSQNKLFEVYF